MNFINTILSFLDKLNSCVTLEDITIDEFKHIFHSPEYMNSKSFLVVPVALVYLH